LGPYSEPLSGSLSGLVSLRVMHRVLGMHLRRGCQRKVIYSCTWSLSLKSLVLALLLLVVSDGFFDEPSEGLAFAVECLTSLQPLVSMDPDKMEAAVVSVSPAVEEAPGKAHEFVEVLNAMGVAPPMGLSFGDDEKRLKGSFFSH
jgi:hypothetical protein